MASLEKRSGKYRVVFRYGGQKFSRSLNTDNPKLALSIVAKLEDNLARAELGTFEIPPNVDVCSFLLSDGKLEKKRKLTSIRSLAKLTKAFIEAIPEGSIEDGTIRGMETHIRHLLRILGPRFRVSEMTLAVVQGYVNDRGKEGGQRGRTISPATIKKEIVTLTSIWRWATRMKYVSEPLPKSGLRYPKANEKPPFQTWDEIEYQIQRGGLSASEVADLWDSLFLTLEEVEKLLSDVKSSAAFDFIYPMVVFAAHTGARRSEVLRSRVTDVDLKTKVVVIREKKRVRGKFSTRRVPLSPFAADVLSGWLANHPGGQHLFCYSQSQTIGEPLTKDQAHHHLQHTVSDTRWNVIRGWHVFRHSFCSNCAAKGIDQRIINAWVGHQTEEMVRRYRHLIPNQQQEAISRVFETTGAP